MKQLLLEVVVALAVVVLAGVGLPLVAPVATVGDVVPVC